MVMGYTLITFLNLSGIMPLIGKLLAPVMGIFGLPGEASVVLLAAFFAKAAGCATAAGMYMSGNLTAVEATILFPACITMGTLTGFCQNRFSMQSARSLLSGHVCNAVIDAVIVMFLTRLVLVLMGY